MDNDKEQELPSPGEALDIGGTPIPPQQTVEHTALGAAIGKSASDTLSRMLPTRRTLGELPAPSSEMNTVGLVLFYHLSGIAPTEIADATGLAVDEVKGVMELDSFINSMEAMVEQVLEAEKSSVRGILEASAKSSARRMTELALEKKGGTLGFMADKEILDRAGYTPKHIIEHKHKVDGGLTINLIKKDQTKEIPTIDVTPMEIN